MAESTSVDYEAVLADLRAKRDKIDAAIQGIEVMLGIQAQQGEAAKPHKDIKDTNILGPGAFLGMTIADAAKKYLEHKRQTQRTEEILKALVDGGLVLTGGSPLNVVGSVLNRNYNNGGDIVKVGRGIWGLATWHPRLKKKPVDAKNGGSSGADQAPEPNDGQADEVTDDGDNPFA